jgi:glucose/arabinose dehydrogenase
LSYTQSSGGASVVSEFAVSGDPNVADTGSEDIIIGPISQPASNHNGGMIAFGPDGMLYYALGDGGSAGDPFGTIGNGQDTTTLLGSILRLDVDSPPDPGLNYAIPADNPFVGGTGPSPSTREEIYAYGLRNTWRFSFDRGTGQLFAGDVGQGSLEEVDIIVSGGNYGWRRMEGTACFNPSSGCQTGSLILPITQYSNTGFGGDCSITGGYVYRGSNYPPIQGNYFYGDYCSGRVWMAEEVSPGVWTDTQILNTTFEIAGFGEDEDGEIYICDIGGGAIYQLTGPVPVALSSFGLE